MPARTRRVYGARGDAHGVQEFNQSKSATTKNSKIGSPHLHSNSLMQTVAHALSHIDEADAAAMALELIDTADLLGLVDKPIALDELSLVF